MLQPPSARRLSLRQVAKVRRTRGPEGGALDASAALNFTSPGVYDLELVSGGGVVAAIIYGAIGLRKEVTV